MSGRTLRRLPLLAHARTAVMRSGSKKLTMETYLDGMLAAVEDDKSWYAPPPSLSLSTPHFTPLIFVDWHFSTAKLDKDKGGIS